jgi:hypothetical protein
MIMLSDASMPDGDALCVWDIWHIFDGHEVDLLYDFIVFLYIIHQSQ